MILNDKLRNKLQTLSLKFLFNSRVYYQKIDGYRSENLNCKKFYTRKKLENLRILHITNFNERLDGRLFLIQVAE